MGQLGARVIGGVLAAMIVVGAIAFAAGVFDSDRAEKLASRVTASPGPSPSQVPYITIRGEQVALVPGMTYGESPAPTAGWRVTYDPGEGPGRVSWLDFDNKFTLVASQIWRADRDLFAPLLSRLDLPFDDFEDPPPTHLLIRDKEVAFAPGMTYLQRRYDVGCYEPCPSPSLGWQVIYDLSPEDDAPESWIIFDQSFNILRNRILDEDRELFKPLLDALKPSYDIFASPPAYIFIKGRQVPLALGMTYGQSAGPYLPPGVQPPIWHLSYAQESDPLLYSELVFDSNYTLLESRIQPEHRNEFQPLLDAFAAP